MPTIPFDRLWRGDPSPRKQWIVHHPGVYVAAIALVDIPGELHRFFPGVGWLTAVNWVATGAAQIVLIAFLWSTIQHMRGFCDTCYAQPLGGPQTAERRRAWLWLWHRLATSKLVLLGALASLAVGSIAVGDRPWPNLILSVAAASYLTAMLYAERHHSWLLPWCPWCRDDGGPDLVEPDVPVPTGQKVA